LKGKDMNIFEQASKNKTRFATNTIGELTVEQLWDLPLTARGSQIDLDKVAKIVNAALKAETEESFVVTRANAAQASLELKMDIVKHIIAVKMAEKAAASEKAANATRRAKLMDILEQKRDESLLAMTPEEIQKELAELSKTA
jgi:imidazolonepropionase-like amidohydrolase